MTTAAATGPGPRVALVTGGGTGIGAATAHRFVDAGWRVAVTGRRTGPLQAIAERTGALMLPADAADPGQAGEAVAAVLREYGRLDATVANAGGHGFSRLTETTDAEWSSSIRANLDTAFVTARAAMPALTETCGALVVVSSLSGLAAAPETLGYTTTKHALLGLMRSIARDYGPRGVRANAICPGWVRTPMADDEMDELASSASLPDRAAAYTAATADVPLRRAAEPAEIAEVIHFLASPAASYITGAVLPVDGGARCVDLPTLAFDRAED
ncbi:SDR family NAD(P)-dependent oxidoreductase [Georgenia deserti]|uniref:SDR family NAD(P)-dependent oxidoreductase n=1 Tax=Georgenia deserti TaxID=2093781 RepID=A0ABW4L8L4_9MICO